MFEEYIAIKKEMVKSAIEDSDKTLKFISITLIIKVFYNIL